VRFRPDSWADADAAASGPEVGESSTIITVGGSAGPATAAAAEAPSRDMANETRNRVPRHDSSIKYKSSEVVFFWTHAKKLSNANFPFDFTKP
jgi:hypothetical protein